MKSLNILVIGSGMYVSGRGTEDYGTIMPAICEWGMSNELAEMQIVGNTRKGIYSAKDKINRLQKKMGSKIDIKYFSKDNKCNVKYYKELFENIPNPACAIIAVPDNLHKKIATATVKAGIHTFVVKPLVSTSKELNGLLKLQVENNVYCAVDYHKRYDYANLKMKDCIEQGIIGDPLYFLAEFSQRKSMPTRIFKKWIKATNVFQYLGIHYVDIIYFVTKAIPKRVMAIGQKNLLYSIGIDSYDSIETIIEWELPNKKKFVSCIITNWIDPEKTSAMSDQKIKVIGTKGRFESDQKNRGINVVTDEKGIEEPNPYFCASYGSIGNISYKGYGIKSIHQFLDDVMQIESGSLKIEDLEGKRPTFKESIIPTKILEAINTSLGKNGEWIVVK